MPEKLGWLDYAVILAYLAGTLWLGLKVGAKLKSGTDFFLAGRTLPWWAVGFSLVATDIGATDIIGGGGGAYSSGMAISNFEWIGCVPAMIVAAFVFIPFFHRTGVTTIPEYMERRFNPALRGALALCLLAFMACNLGVMLFASAKMLVPMIGLNEAGWILIVAAVVGIYTGAGGLAAVVYTDVLQCILMIGGCLAIVAYGLWDLGGPGPLLEKVRAIDQAKGGGADHLSLLLPADTKTAFPWTGILFGLAFVLSPAYWIGNQAIIQRSLGARSPAEARSSYVAGALLKNVIPLIYAVPGLIALALYPRLEDADQAIPTLASTLLPMGLRGLFLAAFLAALMSSVDSYVNSGATILTKDLYVRFLRPGADEARILALGRWATAGLLGFAVLFALGLTRLRNAAVYSVFQTMMSFFQGPLLAILLAGVLTRRATGKGALAGFGAGVLTAVLLFTLNLEAVRKGLGLQPLFQVEAPFLYYSLWSFVVAAGVIAVVSRLTPAEPEEKLRNLVYGGGP